MTERRSIPASQHQHQVDLDLGLDDDQPHEAAGDVTAPIPTLVNGKAPMSDGAKIGIGTVSTFTFLALVDKALSTTGLTAADVLDQLGPALGALYTSYPVVGVVLLAMWLIHKMYSRDQDAHRRRDRRLQHALMNVGQQIARLRADVNGIPNALADVRAEVEAKIVSAVAAASSRADDRANRTDLAISDLQRGLASVDMRVRVIEGRDAAPEGTPSARRRPR